MTSPDKLNELNFAEEPARRLLERLGWKHVPPTELAGDRGSEREVLLRGRLQRALLRLNEGLTGVQADRAIDALRRIDGSGIALNRAVHERLAYGLTLPADKEGGPGSRVVRFFDFDDPENGNEFAVTTQFRVRRGNERYDSDDDERTVRPDLVLFVNGIPLVVMEAKSPTLMGVWKSKAVRQLRRYQEADPEQLGAGAPALFATNLLCVAHCGAAAVYGPTGAPERGYAEWNSLPCAEDEFRERFGEEPAGQALLIAGLLSPATLLGVLRDFVVYEHAGGRLTKKLPRYQQHRAVLAAMERIRGGARPGERGGVIWHTQGSGKSLTMLWLATRLRREMGDALVLVVTDRTQLDRQIAATFERCAFPAPEQAASARDLRRLISYGAGRTVMTTIQKFGDALDGRDGTADALNGSERVFVMVDEAHRTQYGALAARLSLALPNAALIGFTGTPIDKGFRRSTMSRFGPLIDAYKLPQSVADGATVPIRYEARLPDLAVHGPDSLDRLFEALFGGEPEETREAIRRRYATSADVAGAEQRIEAIALDIAEHFKARIRPNGFKAQVVAPSRRAALRYAERLNEFGVEAYPIVTATTEDGPEFRTAREIDHRQVIGEFLDFAGSPEALVVVDMLLTGFDAPVEQALYLDHPMREHQLLQAIARVNRPYSLRQEGVETEKTYGLVVDYWGVSRDLGEALAAFDREEVQDAMRGLDEDPGAVIEAAAIRAEGHFPGLDPADTGACVAVFTANATTEGDFRSDAFERFDADYRVFSRLTDLYLPDARAVAYADRLARLTEIRACVRAQFLREDAVADWTAVSAKVKRLLDERIGAEVRQLMSPVSILDADFERKIAALPHDETRASFMEHAIRARIAERLPANPVFYERLSERLERIIGDLRARVIDAAEASRRMALLAREAAGEMDAAAQLGLSLVAYAIHELLGADEAASGSVAEERGAYGDGSDRERLAREAEECINGHSAIVDWQWNAEVLREMRRDVKAALRRGGYPEPRLDELAHLAVDAARRTPP